MPAHYDVVVVGCGSDLALECPQIPTGDIAPVEGTAFDFLSATAIGARWAGACCCCAVQLACVLTVFVRTGSTRWMVVASQAMTIASRSGRMSQGGQSLVRKVPLTSQRVPGAAGGCASPFDPLNLPPRCTLAANRVTDPDSGRCITVHTTQPGMQVCVWSVLWRCLQAACSLCSFSCPHPIPQLYTGNFLARKWPHAQVGVMCALLGCLISSEGWRVDLAACPVCRSPSRPHHSTLPSAWRRSTFLMPSITQPSPPLS